MTIKTAVKITCLVQYCSIPFAPLLYLQYGCPKKYIVKHKCIFEWTLHLIRMKHTTYIDNKKQYIVGNHLPCSVLLISSWFWFANEWGTESNLHGLTTCFFTCSLFPNASYCFFWILRCQLSLAWFPLPTLTWLIGGNVLLPISPPKYRRVTKQTKTWQN